MTEWALARRAFFKSTLGTETGYVCITTIQPQGPIREKMFHWPEEFDAMEEYIARMTPGRDVYFCPQLFADPNYSRTPGASARVKENISSCPCAWADLDTCAPEKLLVPPTIAIESSPGRYQAVWRILDSISPETAEDASRRIAYHHIVDGADKSGWDLTQLLRVPYTFNHKYPDAPMVHTPIVTQRMLRLADFAVYPVASRRTGAGIPLPDAEEIPEIKDPIAFMQEKRKLLNSEVFRLFTDTPEGSWSEPLWKLMMYLLEGGLSREEVFAITTQAACNKYVRDNKSPRHLWDDICRAYVKHMEDIKAVFVPELEHIDLLTPEEAQQVREHYTFVERYITWATSLGDAAPQYHQAGAFITLSALLSGRVSLPTSFGTIIPNLWFMILADTTLTRKSTAMDISVDLLLEVDPDVIMATDGSIEGMLEGLSTRPGRPSIFLRDEFTGLLESMTKKDYMAGMAETLTKLYDGKYQKRLLRKQTVEIRDPVFIVFAGGIRNRTQQLLNFDHVSSGFMPRFIFLTAESDPKRVKPLGPPIKRDMSARDELLGELRGLFGHYNQMIQPAPGSPGIPVPQPRKWQAQLTPAAWARFNQLESQLLEAGVKSDRPDILTPVYSRLGVSTLKAALLMAASETREDEVIIEEIHILHAISFASKWREHAIDIINGVGKSSNERDIERVLGSIQRQPGVTRSALMQSYHLTARSADSIFQTLEQRGLVSTARVGRTTSYRALEGNGNATPQDAQDE